MNPTKYILYCAQEANFQTRSMLIPYDLIMKCPQRVKDLELLREYCQRNIPFTHKDQTYVVDQLLIQNITWNANVGTPDETPFMCIIGNFTGYADPPNDNIIFREYDAGWSQHIIRNVASNGFNHIANYCKFRDKKEYKDQPIDIVEGFLVLQSDNGKLNIPGMDTVKEMFTKYYGNRENKNN